MSAASVRFGMSAPSIRRRLEYRRRDRDPSRSTGRDSLEGFDPATRLGRPGDAAVHPRHLPVDVPRPPVDHAAVRGHGDRARSRTPGTATCWTAARPGCRSPSTFRPRWGTTPTIRGPRARWARPAWPSTRSRTCGRSSTDIPLDQVTTSMTINATAPILLLLYELVAEEQGVGADRARRDGPERHPQGVRGPRDLHLPAEALDAPDHRPVRVLPRAHPQVEHDLDLAATTCARPGRRPSRRWRSPWPTRSPTSRPRWTPACTSTSSAPGCRSSSPAT